MKSSNNRPKRFIILICILFSIYAESFAQTCSGTTTLTSFSGTIKDGSGTSDYSNNLNCSWLIKATGASIISIKFDSLDIEFGHDSIVIFDGGDSLAPIIGNYSGSSIPSNIISSDSVVFIKFHTNNTITKKGFELSYTGIDGCSGKTTITDAFGTFSDGSKDDKVYLNQRSCEWLIDPPGAQKVLLNFTRFNTESDFDIVEVFDGNSTSSPLLGSFSGSDIPSQLVANSGTILVTFTSDISIQRLGWEANFISSKGHCIQDLELSEESGIVRDGSDTNNYDNELNCSWIINTSSLTPLTFTFESFNTELNNDVVNFYDGLSSTDSLLASYSGDTMPAPVSSTGGDMYIEFITNDTITSSGWEGFYTNVPGGGGGCQGTKILTDTSGTFTDGSGNADYKNNLNCGWLIQPSNNPARITITFDTMNTSGFGDNVRIFDGVDNTGAFLGFLSLTNKGQAMNAVSGSAFIEFNTDNFGTGVGWEASYTTSQLICEPQIFTGDFGNFNDGSGFGADYLNDLDCSYLIQPSTPNRTIRAFVFGINTEAGADTLTIYDGPDATYPKLRTISGLAQPFQTINSSGGSMYMTFKTNDTITHSGWLVSYNTFINPTCQGNTTLTAASGTFNDGSVDSIIYTENNNCSWLIKPPGASKISLNFNRFDTENTFDVVKVYDGINPSAPLLGQFSGGIIPQNITSSGGSLFLTFMTDGAINNLGWEATYTSSSEQCFDTANVLRAARDTITDGSDTADYSANLNCSWLIQPPNSDSISLNFINFRLSLGDTLWVFDGDSTNATILGSFTGISIPPSLTSSSPSLLIKFTTDGSANLSGWKAFYESHSNLSCTGLTSLIAPNGTISDGSNTDDYDENLHCAWLIQPPGVTSIEFTMDSIDLGDGDVVNVYNGTDNLSPLLRSYTTPSTLKAISTTGTMYVEFISDNSSTSKGWTASYSSSISFCQPNNVFTATSMAFNDGSITGDYKNNTHCEWLIQPSTPNLLINLRFFSLETELNKDSVIVYDGSTTSDPILKVFTGRKSAGYLGANRVNSTGATMLVVFKTNDSGTDNGWRANYTTFPAPMCSGTTTFLDSSATFNDGSADGSNYGPSSDCAWLIAPPHATEIRLSFNYFETQAGVDSLRIYNGNSNSSPLLGTFSGSSLPSQVTASSGKMYLEFKTNAILQLNGWEAQYSATIPKILTVATDTIFLNDSVNSTDSFNVVSSLSWTTRKDTGWFSVSPDSANGDNAITVSTTQANTGFSPRFAKVFVEAVNDPLSDTVIIAQKELDHLFVSTDTIFIDNQVSASNTYNVTSNLIWVTGSNASWLSQSPDTGNASNSVTVTVLQTNTSFVTRYAKAFVDGIGTSLTDTIIIVQEGLNQLKISEDTVYLDNVINSSDIYNVISNTTWITGSDVNWFSQTPDTSNSNNKVTVIALQTHSGLDTRYGKAFVDALNDSINDTIVVAQRASDQLSLSQDTIFIDNQVNAFNTYDVVSNIQWVTGTNASWFSQSPDTGDASAAVTVTASQINTTFITRFAKAFVDGVGNNLTDTIIIAQRGLNQLVLSPDTIVLNNDLSSTNSYSVTSNTSWVTGANVNWFSQSPDTSINNDTVVVSVAQLNPGLNTRFGKAFVDIIGDTLSDTVVVAQRATDQLSLNQDTIFVDNQVSASNIYDVVSNIQWVTGTNASWFSQSPDTGNASAAITVTASQINTTFITRFAKAFVDGVGNNLTDTIIIAQRGLNQLVLSPDTIVLDNDLSSTNSYNVTSNTSWVTGANVNWFSQSPDTSINNDTVVVSVAQLNPGLNTRFGKAFVDIIGDTLTDTVIVAQRASDQLSLNQDTIFVDNQVSASNIYDVVSNIQWVTGTNASWFSQSPDTGNASASTTVTVLQTNTSITTRYAKAFVDGVGNNLTDTIIIAQEGIDHVIINSDTIFIDNQINASNTYDVVSDIQWVTGTNASWFSQSPDTGNASTTVTVTASQINTTFITRFAKAFVDGVGNNLTDTIIIAQRGLNQLVLSPDTILLDNDLSSTNSYNVTSNTSWVTGANVNWFSQSPDTSINNDTVVVSVAQLNPGLNTRFGKAFVDIIGDTLTDTVIVAQRASDQLSLNQDTIFVDNQVNAFNTYDVVSNIQWVTGTNASWFTQSPDTGIASAAVTVTASQINTTFITRFAKAFVDAVGDTISDTIIIAQRGLNRISIVQDTIFINDTANSSGSFDVLSNAKWTSNTNVSWLGLSPDTLIGDDSVTLTALQNNPNVTDRFAQVYVVVVNDSISDSVVIVQRGRIPFLSVGTKNLNFKGIPSGPQSVNISSNVNWIISSSPWLSVSPNNGTNSGIISINAQDNLSSASRRGRIIVAGSQNIVRDTIFVTQDTVIITSIHELNLNEKVQLYPNPTQGKLTLELPDGIDFSKLSLNLISILGEEIAIPMSTKNNNRISANLSGFAKGIYFLKISYEDQIVTRKVSLID